MRLFLDANVLFTVAHNPEGKSFFIIEQGKEGTWELCSSRFAVEEARRNLARKYPDVLKMLDELLNGMVVVSESGDWPCPEGLSEKDRPIFKAACACRATHLITEDTAHFGAFMGHPEMAFALIIQTPSDFLGSL